MDTPLGKEKRSVGRFNFWGSLPARFDAQALVLESTLRMASIHFHSESRTSHAPKRVFGYSEPVGRSSDVASS